MHRINRLSIVLSLIGVLAVCGCAGPKTAADWVEKGAEYEKNNRYEKAIEAYTHALEMRPRDGKIYFYRGMVLMMRRDYDKGIADFTSAVRLNPKDALFYYSRGLAYHTKGDLQRALADARKADALSPGTYKSFADELEDEIAKKK